MIGINRFDICNEIGCWTPAVGHFAPKLCSGVSETNFFKFDISWNNNASPAVTQACLGSLVPKEFYYLILPRVPPWCESYQGAHYI